MNGPGHSEAIGDLVEAHPEGSEADWIAACARVDDTPGPGDPDLGARRTPARPGASAENDLQTELNTALWLARCAFAAGRPADAVRWSEPFIRHTETDAYDSSSRWSRGSPSTLAGSTSPARSSKRSSDQFGGVVDHDLSSLRAGIAAAEGRTADALAPLPLGPRRLPRAGCRFDVALTILDMAVLIGPDEPAVRSSIPEGREILESLGAQTAPRTPRCARRGTTSIRRRPRRARSGTPDRSRPGSADPPRQVEGGSLYSPPQWTRGGRGSTSSTSSGASSRQRLRPASVPGGERARRQAVQDDRQEDGPGDDRGQWARRRRPPPRGRRGRG